MKATLFFCMLILFSCSRSDADDPSKVVIAIINHDSGTLQTLLDSGSDANELSPVYKGQRRIHWNTPLAWAVENNCDTNILLLLLNHGAMIDLFDSSLFSKSVTPLWFAIDNGNISIVQFLLRHGADPNAITTFMGPSSLDEAVSDRDFEVPNFTRSRDSTRFGDTSRIIAQLKYDTIINMLLDYGASPSRADFKGWTPMHTAAEFCDSVSMEKFLARGTSPEIKDRDGSSPEKLAKDCPSVLAIIQKHETKYH